VKLAIMQPYLFPYIGYFQLMQEADVFVIYDDVQFIKGGWINRNRILLRGGAAWITLPVARAPLHSRINERRYALDHRQALRSRQMVAEAYRKAPFFEEVVTLVDQMFANADANVAVFNQASLQTLADALGVKCEFLVSSQLNKTEGLAGAKKVLDLCTRLGAKKYINLSGGVSLYSREEFAEQGVELAFLRSRPTDYPQFGAPHAPFLSILDVMMFNRRPALEYMLRNGYDLF
jgi:WbqC-like protein family